MELPRTVQEIADVIGRERALFLIGQLPKLWVQSQQYHKVILYVPKRLKPSDPLVKILGWNEASKMVQHFGGEMLHPANCEYIYRHFIHRSIKRMHSDGMDAKAIAELLDVSERTVKRHCTDKPHKDTSPANDNTAQRLSTAMGQHVA